MGPYFPLEDSLFSLGSEVLSTRGDTEGRETASGGVPPVGTTTTEESTEGSRRGDTTREDHDT